MSLLRRVHEKESAKSRRPNPRKLDELNTRYETRLACRLCCKRKDTIWELLQEEHECQENGKILIVRERGNNGTWYKVRQCPIPEYRRGFTICRFFKGKGGFCRNGDVCRFAHTIAEVDFWNCQRDGLLDFRKLYAGDKKDPLDKFGNICNLNNIYFVFNST